MSKTIKPFMNIKPGEFIREELESRNWTQRDLADILGESAKYINDLVKGRQSISAKTARQLSLAFGQSPNYWLNLQNDYNLMNENDVNETEIMNNVMLYQKFPIAELRKKKWIPDVKDAEIICKSLSKLIGVEFSTLHNTIGDLSPLLPVFRKSEAYDSFSCESASLWFQIAKNMSKSIQVSSYKPQELESLFQQIPFYSSIQDGIKQFLSDLGKTGIKFMVLEHLTKTYIDGASFFDGSNPVIVYTARQNRIDNFWFVVSHEIVHILKHLKPDGCFIDEKLNETGLGLDTTENEANAITLQVLKANEISESFAGNKYISRQQVEQFAKAAGISPAIVVGILQYKGWIPWRNLNDFKVKATEQIPAEYIFPTSDIV